LQLNAIPLKYGASIVHEEANLLEATHLEWKEGTVHEEDAATQMNEAEVTSADPSINYAELTKGDGQWQARESGRKGRPPLWLTEETPSITLAWRVMHEQVVSSHAQVFETRKMDNVNST
jgi:hypothetical protein